MAFEQYFLQGWESIPPPATESGKVSSPCFDCSICLDFACDPVVTLCGHLYCWPCIYKWLDTNSLASDDELPKCPVCKSQISQNTIIPLYGRGQSVSESKGKVIPPRPPAINSLTTLFNRDQQQHASRGPHPYPHTSPNSYTHSLENSSPTLFDHSDSVAMAAFNPTVGMLGEMVYARVFGNSQSLYTYPSSYHTVVNSTPRLRRRHLQAQRSLNRVSIFLLCFCLLCLLAF